MSLTGLEAMVYELIYHGAQVVRRISDQKSQNCSKYYTSMKLSVNVAFYMKINLKARPT